MKRSVVVIIWDKEKSRFLAIKRRDVPIWVLPGGGIDDGETPEKAAVREALEETGLEVAIKRQIAEYSPINKLSHSTFLFECSVVNGTPKKGEETREAAFFSLENLPHPFFHVHTDMLQDALQMADRVIRKPLSQVTYFAFVKYFFKHPIRVLRFAFSQLGLPINSK